MYVEHRVDNVSNDPGSTFLTDSSRVFVCLWRITLVYTPTAQGTSVQRHLLLPG